MTVWPLADIGPNQWQEQDLEQRGLTDYATGIKSARKRTDELVSKIKTGWTVQPDELATFNAFYRDDLYNGVAFFAMRLPITDNPDYLDPVNGLYSIVRFAAEPRKTKGPGTSWNIAAELDWYTSRGLFDEAAAIAL